MSLYFRFYEVTILETTYVTSEGKKMQSAFLDVKLCLYLKPNSLPPIDHLQFRIDIYFFQA
jgi:hypothetical protein